MTREEILEQAKVGGFAVVRVKIANAIIAGDYQGRIIPEFKRDDHGIAYILPDDVIAIDPPPKTDTEKLADALAEIERLNGLLHDRNVKDLTEGLAKKDPNPWRDHDGGDMPCDGDLKVDYVLRDGYQYSATASQLRWLHRDFDHPCHINRWRPHVGVG